MFIFKFMGFLDLLTGFVMLLFNFGLVSGRFMVSFMAYLIIKGLMFKGDIASFIDILIALYIVLMFIYPITIITIIIMLYLFQKGMFSLIS
ncbi:MAG: hypothetical protein ACMXX9_04515 [Candidatus Woesearchaeota archaeon]